MLKCMYQAFQLVKYQKLWKNFGKSVSKSFVSSLTEQLEPMVNEWQNRLLSEKLSLLNDRCTLYKKYEKKIEYSQKLSYSDWNNQRWDREIIGFMIQSGESEDLDNIFEYLKNAVYKVRNSLFLMRTKD